MSFQVSVTRAKALLVVIGDPSVLSLDPLWRAFLKYVHDNGGWKGPPISPELLREDNDNDGSRNTQAALANMNELTRRMEVLTLAGANNDENDDVGVNVDRPWREVE
jgi:helicase MOV-10